MVKPTVHRRRASWIGFFLVVLASFTVCRAEQYRLSKTSTDESVAVRLYGTSLITGFVVDLWGADHTHQFH